MTAPIGFEAPEQTPGKAPRLGRGDPLLQELWAAKAALNAAAGYSAARLAEQANAFDLQATLAQLKRDASH